MPPGSELVSAAGSRMYSVFGVMISSMLSLPAPAVATGSDMLRFIVPVRCGTLKVPVPDADTAAWPAAPTCIDIRIL